jgi:hypothetical protein
MPTHHEILQAIARILKELRGNDPLPLSFPPSTPAGRAYYELSSLYMAILLGTKIVEVQAVAVQAGP